MPKFLNLKITFILKTVFLAVVFSLLYFFVIQPPSSAQVVPCASHTLSGYAWSENIGWISFSCSGSGEDYGVDVDDDGSGKMSGYAWSENIGWISFNKGEFGNCPSGSCQPKLRSDNTFEGWARACTVFQSGCSGALKSADETGNWDGWISLASPTPSPDYKVNLNPANSELEGWAWGSDVAGWISFNHLNCDPDNDNKSEGVAGCPALDTPISEYKVIAASLAPTPPTALQVKVKGSYYTSPSNVQDPCAGPTPCALPQTPKPYFQWTPGGTQDHYQIQVDDDSNFSSPLLWDSPWINSSSPADALYGSQGSSVDLSWGATYYWRVQTKNPSELLSGWSAPAQFTTNRYPIAGFSISRSVAGGNVTFTFTSTSIDPDESATPSGGIILYEWDFDYSAGVFNSEATGQTVQKVFPLAAPVTTVALRVTDDGGLQDIEPAPVSIQYLPQIITESGDIYTKGDLQGKNINFDAAYLILANGVVTDVAEEYFQNYGAIDFPQGDYEQYNILGKIDWDGLKPPSACVGIGVCSKPNKYGHTVEIINNQNQIDDPLGNKVYYYDGNFAIDSSDLLIGSDSATRGNGLIMVKGDLIINKNIKYDVSSVSDPRNLSSIGFIVKGDLIINPAVTKLFGAYVILGDGANNCAMTTVTPSVKYTIKPHCGLVRTGSQIPAPDVSLDIKGLLFARRFFFQRAVKTYNEGDYAEKITYDYQLFLNPPPGMEDFIGGLPVWKKTSP